ncbi:hypothetical protein Tco_0626328 [Tanacetum coccineum]|uniref:Uncharacterized protein n=1 Tax=Tanacetum coccineum TaxID=301880 RepID=A0ABQ4WK28_9ASTR
MMYLTASTKSISAALFTKREEEHVPIYFISRVPQGAELNYPRMEVTKVETKEGESWMTPIHEYLVSGLLSEDPKESRKIRVKAPQFAMKVLQDCKKWKEQSSIKKVAESGTITAGCGGPFNHWGVNILGPLPTAPGGFKFLAIAVEHSMKWVEAKPLTVINGRHAERFVWEYVVTLPRNSQKETPFSLTYGSEAIILISENDVAKDDRGRIKEVDKRRESKEIASIEEAYYQSKFRGTITKGVVSPFIRLETSFYFRKTTQQARSLEDIMKQDWGFTMEASAGGDIGLKTGTEDGVAL